MRAATTAEKATRRRGPLGDRAHEMHFASKSQHAEYYAKTQPPPPTEKPVGRSQGPRRGGPAAHQTWMKCVPTSGRIVEDIVKILPVPGKITEAKGGVVPGEFYRTGRR